ncbi:MAG: YceI family protein [Burkholderiales bacterium]
MNNAITQTRFTQTLAGLTLLAALIFPVLPAAAADPYQIQTGNPAGNYQIDPVHSMVSFTVGHLGVSELVGRFDTISGSFSLDSANSGQARVSVQIPIDSLDTNFAQRNKDLLGPDYFNATQFPTMSFVSTKVQWQSRNAGLLTGNLTLHGVTRPVTFNLRRVGAGPDPWGGYRSGYIATATIRRSDFGMNYMLNGISDSIALQLNIEGKRQ